MLDTVLQYFPEHTHPLTLVSDPDGLLADEEVRGELERRGFRLLEDADPVALRYQVERVRPFTSASPLVIVTPAPVNTLPYDLWQQGRRVVLDVRQMFPTLDAGVVRTLSAGQRRRLGSAVSDDDGRVRGRARSRGETVEYVLERVFGFTAERNVTSASLLIWLALYHTSGDAMPLGLREHVLHVLQRAPEVQGWPLDALLTDAGAFRRFVQRGWDSAIARTNAVQTQRVVKESREGYGASPSPAFDSDPSLQDAVAALVRAGAIAPVPVAELASLPAWARSGAVEVDAEMRSAQFAEALGTLDERLREPPSQWQDWQEIAWVSAQLAVLRHDTSVTLDAHQRERYERAVETLDASFYAWLDAQYAPLAARSLPTPNHLFQVPAWLEHRRGQQPGMRPALLVLDGLALADWLQIRPVWQQRHPAWDMDAMLILAQAPSITAVSRLALVAGRRPNTFTSDALQNGTEKRLWQEFWQGQGVPADAAVYAHLSSRIDAHYPDEIGSHRTQALCLVSIVMDDLLHGAAGATEMNAALRVWLQGDEATQHSPWLEGLIERLLDGGYAVTITSDHGHIEAVGMGAPREGVISTTRSKRARLYSTRELAQRTHAQMPDTIVLESRWLPPGGVFPLVATGRRAFAPAGERVVTHGGLSIEEMVVPLITVTKK